MEVRNGFNYIHFLGFCFGFKGWGGFVSGFKGLGWK